MPDNNLFPMHVGIVVMSAAQLAAVYALLGGASPVAVTKGPSVPGSEKVNRDAFLAAGGDENSAVEVGKAIIATSAKLSIASAGSSSDEEIDAHGWPWSADMHASTKGKTKEGLWRMKVGVSRPDPKPGFPVEGSTPATGTEAIGAASTPSTSVTSPTATETAPAQPDTSSDEDDEFAAFRAAAAKSDAEDAAAKASVPARKWTDADLGALCNQAAVKLGDPSPVKEIIAQFIPEGTVAHSRNIPEDQRENFAKAVEAKAGIEFAG